VKSSFGKIRHHKGFDMRIFAVLADAFESAVFMYDEPVDTAHKAHTNFTGYSHYASVILIDGSPVYARFTLENLKKKPKQPPASQFHSIHLSREVKNNAARPRVHSSVINLATWGANGTTDSKLSQWLNFVKGMSRGQNSGLRIEDGGLRTEDAEVKSSPRPDFSSLTPQASILMPHPCLLTPILFVCAGGIFPETLAAARLLSREGIVCDIYNLRFLKPIDEAYFLSVASAYKAVVFAEDGAVAGGIGRYLEHILKTAPEAAGVRGTATRTLGFPDRFLAQGKRAEILEDAGLSPEAIADAARTLVKTSASLDSRRAGVI
jgi:hypothetical protein